MAKFALNVLYAYMAFHWEIVGIHYKCPMFKTEMYALESKFHFIFSPATFPQEYMMVYFTEKYSCNRMLVPYFTVFTHVSVCANLVGKQGHTKKVAWPSLSSDLKVT